MEHSSGSFGLISANWVFREISPQRREYHIAWINTFAMIGCDGLKVLLHLEKVQFNELML